MASQWYSLASQKLYLAQILLAQLGQANQIAKAGQSVALREALTQGIAELLLRARATLLTMIARYHQQKHAEPRSLEELKALLPYDTQEIDNLEALAADMNSWWYHLEQLEKAMKQPPVPKKTVSAENIIAVSSEQVTDRSPESLEKTLTAMIEFTRALEERQSEW
ncbi:DUF6586 family protein [Marinobacter sp.]|uniref:DUF6586 family protein n=1 Tax=Marinobacter sp. TaxID=50741 RepID=UPI0035638FE7